MTVVLAVSAIFILTFGEIAALVPTRDAKRLRIASLLCAAPFLALFALAWLLRLQAVLATSP